MAINLQKGQTINLEKDSFDLSSITIGLGWDVNNTSNDNFDLDAFALLCDKNGKIKDFEEDIVYFGNLTHNSNTVNHTGDNLTGEGDGDDEQIIVKLGKIPSNFDKIIFGANIFSAKSRNQHFGKVSNSFIRAVDNNGKEIARFTLNGKEYSGKIGMIFGEVYRKDAGWKFRALGSPTEADGIDEIAELYR
jgi:tellurium resistance protein TerD